MANDDEIMREYLKASGWSLWYSDDYWVHPKTVLRPAEQDYTMYGMTTARACRFESQKERPFPPTVEFLIYGRDGNPLRALPDLPPATSKCSAAIETDGARKSNELDGK